MAQNDRLRTEQEHHKKAFEIYFAAGSKRTYGQVAQELNVSPRTVKLWARSFGWKERVAERETATARRVADQTLQSSLSGLQRNHKIVEMAIVRLAKAIADGKVRMQLGDLERLIRLQQMIVNPQSANRLPQTAEELLTHLDYLLENVPHEIVEQAIALGRASHAIATDPADPRPDNGHEKGKQNCP